MRVRVLGSPSNDAGGLQYASSYVVEDCIAIDAGYIGFWETPEQQGRIRHVLLTHTHMDHIASLPMFLENAYDPGRPPVTIYSTRPVLESLRQHIFNDVIWPDFIRLSTPDLQLLRFQELEEEAPVRLCSLTVTPVAVSHVVPTCGYILSSETSTVVFGGDSGPTDQIWRLAQNSGLPVSVFLEACFPERLRALASVSFHLTPSLFAAEVRKIPQARTIIATHIKPRYRRETVEELQQLNIPGMLIGEVGREYLL